MGKGVISILYTSWFSGFLFCHKGKLEAILHVRKVEFVNLLKSKTVLCIIICIQPGGNELKK